MQTREYNILMLRHNELNEKSLAYKTKEKTRPVRNALGFGKLRVLLHHLCLIDTA